MTTVEVLEELIKLAQEIRSARERGEESGLSEDEIAFYDALADNQSTRDLIGEPALRVIAHVLVEDIRRNMTVDWAHRESACADIRRRVKRILHGLQRRLVSQRRTDFLSAAQAMVDMFYGIEESD